MNKQDQNVGDASMAVQAAGNITINQAVTPLQIAEIVSAISDKIVIYEQKAKTIVDERLRNFKEEILKEFAKPDTANPEAFSDPDFQYILSRTQQAYVRNSDEQIAEALINMIAERSKHLLRDRLALTMNSAIETSAVLTREEFSELSLLFLLTRIKIITVNQERIFRFFSSTVKGFVEKCSFETPSYDYLVAQDCVTLNMVRHELPDALRSSYGGAFNSGFTMDRLTSATPNAGEGMPQIKIVSVLGEPGTFKLDYVSHEELKAALESHSDYEKIKALYEEGMASGDEIVKAFRANLDWFQSLENLWKVAPISNFSLTSRGIVIAHSNIKRTVGDFPAPLSMWVR